MILEGFVLAQVLSYGTTGHVSVLDIFKTEAECRAHIAALVKNAALRGIPPPSDYVCLSMEQAYTERAAQRGRR